MASHEAHHHREQRAQGDCQSSPGRIAARFARPWPAARQTDHFCNWRNGQQYGAAKQVRALHRKQRVFVWRRFGIAGRADPARSEANDAKREKYSSYKQDGDPEVT